MYYSIVFSIRQHKIADLATQEGATLRKRAEPLSPRRLGQLPCKGRLFARALPAGKPPLTGEVVKRSYDRRGSARLP